MRILYLDIDTLRPDHLGCYGYHRNTSPNIDRIAAQGVRFDNYYCSDAPCLPSRTALMSGRFGIHTGAVNHGGACADMRPEGASRLFYDRLRMQSLPAYLRRACGLRTVSISPFADRHASWSFYAGFSEIHDPAGKGGMESAEEVTPTALDWINRNAQEDNWFLHINYWDPHTPYRAPEAFGDPFKDDPLPDWLTDEVVEKHQQCVGPHGAREIFMYTNKENPDFPRHPGEVTDQASLRRLIDGYDCGIRYCDENVGKLFDALETQGVLDDLVIIISADHGENFGELGIYAEHATADHGTCRIPMIIRWPGRAQAGHVDKGLHYNLDLLPTLAEMIGADPSSPGLGEPNWDGQSYAQAVTQGADCGRDYLVLSQCAHVCQRSVRWDNWLYLRTYHDGFHLFPDEMLFDLAQDPHQQNNLAESRPDLCGQAALQYLKWHGEMMSTSDCDIDPLWTVMREGGPAHAKGCLPAYLEHLKNTGREWAIPILKERHPQEFCI